LRKGSVHFESLLKGAYRLKSGKEREEASRISVLFKDEEPNVAYSLTDDTLFRYLIYSFQGTWEPDLSVINSLETFLREHPIYVDERPASTVRP
jgi:hypothetical protein